MFNAKSLAKLCLSAPNVFFNVLHPNIGQCPQCKCKADNQDELDAIERLKTFHISSEDTIKWKKNENEYDRPKKKQDLRKI